MSPPTSLLYAAALLAATVILPPVAADESSAKNLELAYAVMSGGRNLGTIEIRVERDASPNLVEATTRPKGLAKLFADVVVERFTFETVEDGWQARDYSESGDADDAVDMTFDYGDALRARGIGDDTPYPLDGLVEPEGFPLSTLMLPEEDLPAREILMPTKRGLRSYRYVRQGEERIAIGAASFDTVKWLKQRPDRDDRGFHIWTDKATRVPVRIEKFKDGDVMVIELKPETLATGS